jgi:nicotinate phosphoribosyltransferase
VAELKSWEGGVAGDVCWQTSPDSMENMKPVNPLVGPLLTDLYEISMAYAYWKTGRHEDQAVFDLFFRKNPFGGEYTVFAGLEEVLRYVSNFRFTDEDIEYIASVLPSCDERFLNWLRTVDCSRVRIDAVKEGTVVFPRIPLIIVEGPLAIAQMLETTVLTLINYPTLMATNAARFRLAAGKDKTLLEFGLRRAQGPDGGLSASRYSYIGGFDATSNMLAGRLFGIPVKGTHAHSFVSSFSGLDDIGDRTITDKSGRVVDFVDLVLECRQTLGFTNTNDDELAAFIVYARSFPAGFLALVDTYDTLKSGVPNFLTVAMALHRLGYKPLGIRLDSGDLAFLSKATKRMFQRVSEEHSLPFSGLSITASNDIDEATLLSLSQQGHEIDSFGIGTRLVTCEAQPALGCVYKLVEVNGQPRIKLSQDVAKVTIPGRKRCYRLVGVEGHALVDLMMQEGEGAPTPGSPVLCRHPFSEAKRAYVNPSQVIALHQNVWDGQIVSLPGLEETRAYVAEQIEAVRDDHLRPLNPTPYKVSVSDRLYSFVHDLWMQEAPIEEIK